MSPPRKQPNLTDKCASALLALGHIKYDHAKLMTAAQFLSLYEFHHGIRHAEDGASEFWNLTPMLRAAHRDRTAAIDVPEIAHNKRVRHGKDRHDARMAAKFTGSPPPLARPVRKIASRVNPWPAKGARKMRSGSF